MDILEGISRFDIASIFIGALGLGIAIISYKSSKQSNKISMAQFYFQVFDDLNSDDFQKAKWILYDFAVEKGGIDKITQKHYEERLDENGKSQKDDDAMNAVYDVLKILGQIGTYVSLKLIDKEAIIGYNGRVYYSLYGIVSPFIELKRKTDPNYMNFGENLAGLVAEIDQDTIITKDRKLFTYDYMKKRPGYFKRHKLYQPEGENQE